MRDWPGLKRRIWMGGQVDRRDDKQRSRGLAALLAGGLTRGLAWGLALVATSTAARAQFPDAGPNQALVFPRAATLAGSIQGLTPLRWWTADGNGSFENYLAVYDSRNGVNYVGPLRLATGGTFGYPTDLVRIGSTVYGIDALRRMIYTLDMTSGIVSPIGTAWSATYADVESLAYEATRNRLLAVDRTTGQLLEISRTTGALTPIGNRTLSAYGRIHSLAWRPSNGRLYAVDQTMRRVLSIDPVTGVPTSLSTMPVQPNSRVEELEFVGDKLYGVLAIDDGTKPVAARLQRISPAFGLVQNVGPVVNQVSALCLLIDSMSEEHAWSKVSGPGIATFADPYALNTTVRFSRPGTYVLRLMMSSTSQTLTDTVTITQNEWTTFALSPDTRTVFVSRSMGNDANSGLTAQSPKQSIAAGKALLRHGYPDWLLLMQGDVWDEGLGHWGKSGRSATEPMLVSSYGSSGIRPLLRTGTASGFDAFVGQPNSNLAIVGLHFWANGYTGYQGLPRGLQIFGEVQNFLIEDCYIRGYETNLVIQGLNEYPSPSGRHKNVAIRRCVIVDAFNTGGSNSQGIYASGTDGLILSENVLDRNGWNANVPGSNPTWFRHNVYIQNLNTEVVCVGNIVARTDGLHTRSGGVVEDNLILRNALGLVFGVGGYPAIEPNGVTGTIARNVILDGGDLQPGSARGWGIWMSNVRQCVIDRNVIALNSHGHAPFPVSFDVANNGRGIENTIFSNNVVYAWNGYTRFTGNASQTVNVHLINNKFQNQISYEPLIVHDQPSSTQGVTSTNNTFGAIAASWAWMQSGGLISLAQWKPLVRDTTSVAAWVPFPDPGRSIPTYHASIGGAAGLDAFMTEARRQSRAFWRPQYTAEAVNTYVRAGYGL